MDGLFMPYATSSAKLQADKPVPKEAGKETAASARRWELSSPKNHVMLAPPRSKVSFVKGVIGHSIGCSMLLFFSQMNSMTTKNFVENQLVSYPMALFGD